MLANYGASSSLDKMLLELEQFELPHRVRTPPKQPVNPKVKPRFADVAVSIGISVSATGRISHIGGDYARILIEQAEADGCTTAVAVAEWLNARGYRGGFGSKWSKQSVTRVSGRNLADYEARLVEHSASIRTGLIEAKRAGYHTSKRAAFLNDRGLRTFGGIEWDRKSVARWWKAHSDK